MQQRKSGQPIKTTLVDTGAELVIPRFESNRVRLGEDMASRTQFPARNRRSSSVCMYVLLTRDQIALGVIGPPLARLHRAPRAGCDPRE